MHCRQRERKPKKKKERTEAINRQLAILPSLSSLSPFFVKTPIPKNRMTILSYAYRTKFLKLIIQTAAVEDDGR